MPPCARAVLQSETSCFVNSKTFAVLGKLIAAYNYGIKKVYIPFDNEKDLKEVPKIVLDSMEIKPVKNYDTIFNDLFNKAKK